MDENVVGEPRGVRGPAIFAIWVDGNVIVEPVGMLVAEVTSTVALAGALAPFELEQVKVNV